MKYNRFQTIALLIGCALPILLLSVLLFRGQTDISDSENRTLARFPSLSAASFASGEFQDGLEKALGDQYPFGDAIKSAVLTAETAVAHAESGVLRAVFPDAAPAYEEITSGYYHYRGDEHRIVERLWTEDAYALRIAERAASFNAVSGVDKYVYFIRNSRALDFAASSKENDAVYDCVRSAYQADGFGCFGAGDYDGFCRQFYQTDHHWNHIGADQGYREIVALLLGAEEKTLAPGKEWTFDAVFNGSYARQTKVLCADETFKAYSYPLPGMKLTLNGKKGQYGHQSLYERGRYPTDEMRNHYAYFYGGDYGEIRIDNGEGHGGNLLIIADSYSNPVNLPLASHFDQTYIIDLRYYEKDIGEPFDLPSYIESRAIDKLLLMGDIAFFTGAEEKEAGD